MFTVKSSQNLLRELCILFLFICSATINAVELAHDNDATLDFGEGVTAKIDSVKTWKVFDGKFPSEESYEHWLSGGQYSINVPPFALDSGRLIAGSTQYSIQCSIKVAPFAPPKGDSKDVVKASGKFLQLVLWFTNSGEKETTIWFNNKNEKGLNGRIIVNGQEINISALLIPGLGIANISLVTSWTGKMGIQLKPQEKTWILLVFDVPKESSSGQFLLENAAPISLNW